MRCNDLHDQITACAAGELAPIRTWWLRRHLRHCRSCNERLQQAQSLMSGLTELAEAVPTDTLRDRVFGDLKFLSSRVGDEATHWHSRQALNKTRIRYALAGTLAALTVTGGITVQILRLHRVASFTDPEGQTWYLSGTFVGEARIMNARGQSIGIYRSEEGDSLTGPIRWASACDPECGYVSDKEGAQSGVLNIDVEGHHSEVQGYGDHELRVAVPFTGTPSGIHSMLIGYAFLGWPGDQSPPQRAPVKRILPVGAMQPGWDPKNGECAATTASPWGVWGFDKMLGITWKMVGPGKVQLLEPGNNRMLMTAETKPLRPETRKVTPPYLVEETQRKTPELNWTVHGRASHASGYGSYLLKDEHGQTVVILKAQPLETGSR